MSCAYLSKVYIKTAIFNICSKNNCILFPKLLQYYLQNSSVLFVFGHFPPVLTQPQLNSLYFRSVTRALTSSRRWCQMRNAMPTDEYCMDLFLSITETMRRYRLLAALRCTDSGWSPNACKRRYCYCFEG